MALDRHVYSRWAFSENESEKSAINREIYDELSGKYKVCKGRPKDESEYDIIVTSTPEVYQTRYEIVKNEPKLRIDELALICDNGNLCFGYSGNEKNIIIYTD